MGWGFNCKDLVMPKFKYKKKKPMKKPKRRRY